MLEITNRKNVEGAISHHQGNKKLEISSCFSNYVTVLIIIYKDFSSFYTSTGYMIKSIWKLNPQRPYHYTIILIYVPMSTMMQNAKI